MRVVVTSDTHYHANYADALIGMVRQIAALRPDCFILAGDIGERMVGIRNMLELCQLVDCPRLVLAGNHDLWVTDGIDSETLWRTTIPDLVRENGAIWLEDENWIHGGLGVCGTIGWYDYSGRDPNILKTDDQYYREKMLYNNDGNLIHWQWTDIEFANLVGDAFEQRLGTLQADPQVNECLVLTHVPVAQEAITRLPGNNGWNTGNAYFHNLTLGQRILKHGKVRRIVSGHTHIGVEAHINTAHGIVDMSVIDSDYGAPVFVVLDYPTP